MALWCSYYILINYKHINMHIADGALKVCIVGNAQTKQHAIAMHEMWERIFRSFWYIWDEYHKEDITFENGMTFIYSNDTLSWTKGIELGIQIIDNKKESCDYIFIHDDDLTFHIKRQFYHPKMSLANTLVKLLKTYRPAIASFPWIHGDTNILAMKELALLYENETIAPLTGFDNGMVLFHKSIVNFFIPFSPRGEGNFTSQWTLCAHFLQMFAHLLFKEYAVRLNMFEYFHSVNINNELSNNNSKQKVVIKNGSAYISNARHPYEYPQNKAYIQFLSEGLKFPYQSWGRTLTTGYELTLSKTTVFKRASFDGLWLLNRLNSVYDIRYEALSKNKLLRDQFSDEQKYSILQQTNFTLKLILLTMNRLHSFQRLWKSLNNALPINQTINIFIHMDMDNEDNEKRQQYLEYLNSLRSHHGNVHIIAYSIQRSLRAIMLEAWRPLNNDEYAVFLEDDVELSPYFLLYIEKLVRAYFYNLKLEKRLFGISLYNQRFNEVIDNYISVSNNHQLYAYQMPQSWGALYAPKMWRNFLKFLQNELDPFIPNSYTNRWPCKKSWKKYLLRFMYEQQGCLLYPNFPSNLSLSTNHIEYGMNDKLATSNDKEPLRVKFKVPLLYDKKMFEQLKTPSLDDLQIYNVYHKRVKSLDELKLSKIAITSFDKCTMILTVFDRTNTTLDRLTYYQDFTYISTIIVVWNNVNVQPINEKRYSKFRIPIHILKMTRNSLNNRFYPHKQIQTDCIINMDDDWDMPYSHMAFAIDTWRGHFFNNLVGFSHLGRNHIPNYVNGTLTYTYSSKTFPSKKRAFFSIVLPSGFVYHRRYLYQYTYKLPPITRDMVDSLTNCDDLLLNFLIANVTKQGPVIINAYAKPYNLGGLEKRPNHMMTRSLCLNKFSEIFHGMPLRYTTSAFRIDRDQTIPGKDKHIFQDKIPAII